MNPNLTASPPALYELDYQIWLDKTLTQLQSHDSNIKFMSSPITIKDIYKLFQTSQEQADRRAAELARLAAENTRNIAKLEKTVERTSQAVDALTTRWVAIINDESFQPHAW